MITAPLSDYRCYTACACLYKIHIITTPWLHNIFHSPCTLTKSWMYPSRTRISIYIGCYTHSNMLHLAGPSFTWALMCIPLWHPFKADFEPIHFHFYHGSTGQTIFSSLQVFLCIYQDWSKPILFCLQLVINNHLSALPYGDEGIANYML